MPRVLRHPPGPHRRPARPPLTGEPIGYVQAASTNGTAALRSTTFPLDQTAGDTDIAILRWSGSTIASFSDSQGNQWTAANGPLTTRAFDTMQIFIATDIKGGHNVVNADLGSAIYATLSVLEYASVPTSAIDQTGGMTGTASDTPVTGNVTTSRPNDLLIGAMYSDADLANPMMVGFTTRVSDVTTIIGDRSPGVTGSFGASVTTNALGNWVFELIALRGP